MPQLINYLNHVVPGRTYDEFELARLQQIYEQACEALGVPVGDARRETVATLLFDVESKAVDRGNLLDLAVEAFRQRA